MRPELLAPAGGPEALTAAVQCGADAVYLGVGDFNARRSAKNFTLNALPEAVAYCHLRGVRVYLTLNTLLTDRELPDAAALAAAASDAGVDAVLVQDWGVLRAVRATAPDLACHASTQMSIHNLDGAKAARDLGLRRVVLAREMDREEVARVCALEDLETEVFVHGAHCMSYSGQCAMSALIGGRSGNRGRCAQPCRLPCTASGSKTKYALSLKDLCLAEHLPELAALGVTSLKLEGRMKRAEYVAVVTGVYARLLRENRGPTPAEHDALTAAFSRNGFTDGYFTGRTGGAMFGVRDNGAPEPKDLFAAARAFYERGEHRLGDVSLSLTLRRDAPARLSASDSAGHRAEAAGPVPEAARNHPLTEAEAAARLAKTGGTVYRAASVEVDLDAGLSLSAAALNGLRRTVLEDLTRQRTAPPPRRTRPYAPPGKTCAGPAAPRFTVSVQRAEQVTSSLLRRAPARLYVPIEEWDALAVPVPPETELCAVLPRVYAQREAPELRAMLRRAGQRGASLAAVSNLGHLALTAGCGLRLCGDLGLNLTNSASLAFWRDKGLCSAAASFELRREQLRDLDKALDVEAVVYGRLPLMLLENAPGGADGSGSVTDRTGAVFPLLPVFGGRWELENAKTLFLLDKAELRDLGLAYLRLRFTDETPEECARIWDAAASGAAALPEAGYTRGLFFRGVE